MNQSLLQSQLKLRDDLAALKKNVDIMFLIIMGIFVFCKFSLPFDSNFCVRTWRLTVVSSLILSPTKVYKAASRFTNRLASAKRMSPTSCFVITSTRVTIYILFYIIIPLAPVDLLSCAFVQ